MRKLVPLLISGVAAWSFSHLGLSADGAAQGPLVGPGVIGDPGGADAGARPHLDWKDEKGGTVKAPRDRLPDPDMEKMRPGDASAGSSAPPDADSPRGWEVIESDEDRANRNKDKFRQRPGFRENPPEPRARGPESGRTQ